MGTERLPRVNEQIRTVLSPIIQQEIDPARALVTITKVVTSKDLHYARIYVSVYPDQEKIWALSVLQARSKHLRHELSQSMDMYRVPELNFSNDKTEEKAKHIEDVLDSLHP
jgi:ribosome-binding factor A